MTKNEADNSTERVDARVNARMKELVDQPGLEPAVTLLILDGPYRSFAHMMPKIAKAGMDPEEVASGIMFMFLNMVSELTMMAIGPEDHEERFAVGHRLFQACLTQWHASADAQLREAQRIDDEAAKRRNPN